MHSLQLRGSSKKDSAFSIYMDNHAGPAKSIDARLMFFYIKYFPPVAFGPFYLAEGKLVYLMTIFKSWAMKATMEAGDHQ